MKILVIILTIITLAYFSYLNYQIIGDDENIMVDTFSSLLCYLILIGAITGTIINEVLKIILVFLILVNLLTIPVNYFEFRIARRISASSCFAFTIILMVIEPGVNYYFVYFVPVLSLIFFGSLVGYDDSEWKTDKLGY